MAGKSSLIKLPEYVQHTQQRLMPSHSKLRAISIILSRN